MSIFGLLTGGIKELIGAITGLVDETFTNDEERAEAQAKLATISNALHLELARMDVQFADAQSRVVIAEAQSQSWLARNWRPGTMLVFVLIIFYNYIISPMFTLPLTPIVPDMWALLKLGIGGYIGGRTLEKVVPSIAAAIKGKANG